MKDTYKFYVILLCFVISYFLFLTLTKDEDHLTMLKTTYNLTLGDVELEKLDHSKSLIIVVYTTLIFLVLMNLLIAILSDAYELVKAE